MSIGRDKHADRRATSRVLQGATRIDSTNPGVNWLGHQLGKKAAQMDDMLVEGTTLRALLSVRDTPEASRNHLKHLEKAHGLKIREYPGHKLRFDV